jgi:asparagine N-glycosylation enzyme membrane subunit Stt3
MEALRRDDWRWWAAAGAVAGLGIYTYNADPLFLAILCGYALFRLYRRTAVAVLAGLALYVEFPGDLTLALLVLGIVAVAFYFLIQSS